MTPAKDIVARLLRKLPDDCTLEEIQYHLYVVEKVQHGIDVAEQNGALTQAQAEQRLLQRIGITYPP